MQKILLLFPHQLFDPERHSEIFSDVEEVHLIEDTLFFGDPYVKIPFHKSKLVFHRASMKKFYDALSKKFSDKKVIYHDCSGKIITELISEIGSDNKFKIIDPTDYLLEKRIRRVLSDFEFIESPLFINSREDNEKFCEGKDNFLMHHFYQAQRKRLKIMIDSDGKPEGGRWSFDDENRKKIPKKEYSEIPSDPEPVSDEYIEEAKKYVEEKFDKNPGSFDKFWYPTDHKAAQEWFDEFLEYKFNNFGAYEDAMMEGHHTLYHSVLSLLLNVGLLNPREVVDKALDFASKNNVPINSLEGFVRQIIGWREYIRLQYEINGTKMRRDNYWNHKTQLTEKFWTGKTGLDPLDDTITKIDETGYLHHIERLMIVGNSMFLLEIDPNQVYEWFMSLSIDSYDWVMVPNVYGMSQYTSKDLMTTKPYVSGSNYIKKMSDYDDGDWCEIWDALYWNFILKNLDKLSENFRIGMIVNRAKDFSEEQKNKYRKIVNDYKKQIGL